MRSGSWEPLTIAQVQWTGVLGFLTLAPDAPLGRLAAPALDIPYPDPGEPHIVKLVTCDGVTFRAHPSPVVATTPDMRPADSPCSPVGLMVGLVPVAAGMLFFPVLRQVSRRGLDFVLALTIGLLASC